MTTLSVITPSYEPDFELCKDLHASVLRFAPATIGHDIIVPPSDLDRFSELAGPRCRIVSVRDVLPRSMWRLPRLNMWLNGRRPYPPVRGWIAQQLIKIIAAVDCSDDIALLVDSDVEFIRPFTSDTYLLEGSVRFFRRPDAIAENLPRHVVWHQVARQLLGIDEAVRLPLPDYICWPMAWDPSIVARMLRRVERSTGAPWLNAIGSRLHLSEGILYGVYVDELVRAGPATDSMMCAQYTGDSLDESGLREFLSRVGTDDNCIMVSAKSRTPLDVRRKMIADFIAHL